MYPNTMKRTKKVYQKVFRKSYLILALLSMFSSCSSDDNHPKPNLSDEKIITGFVFEKANNDMLQSDVIAEIDQENFAIKALFLPGTKVEGLIPTITTSELAIVAPKSMVKIDLTYPATYTVKAEDGSISNYLIRAEFGTSQANGDKLITGFVFEKDNNDKLNKDIHAVINESTSTIEVSFLEGTHVSNLKPTITTSELAQVSPKTDIEIDLSSPVIYTVTALNNSTRQYIVKAIFEQPKSDRDILEAFFSANPDNTLDWDLNATDMSNWSGVTLEGDRVTALALQLKKISTIPASFGGLSKLEKLFIYDNNISVLPDTFGQLLNLKTLNINSNKLGHYPVVLEKLDNLEHLILGANQIKELPSSIKNLSDKLVIFSLDENELTTLPAEIGEFKNLQNLSVQRNKLTSLPKEIGLLTQVWTMNLSENYLAQLPSEIGNMRNLKILVLEYNNITGLPNEIGNLKKLDKIHLGNNVLASLPSTLDGLISLTLLQLEYNNLTTVHNSIGGLAALKGLFLNNNQIRELPPEIGNLASIETIDLIENSLTHIPSEIGNLTTLKSLDVSGNALTGLPPEIGNLNTLRYLFVSDNELTSIPEDIGNMTGLNHLHLTGNKLTTIPQAVCNLARPGISILVDKNVTCL